MHTQYLMEQLLPLYSRSLQPSFLFPLRTPHCSMQLVHIEMIELLVNAWFLVAPCCSQGVTLQVILRCRPVVCPWQDPPPLKKFFSSKFFFHPKFFWVKQGATQCYQAFLVSYSEHVPEDMCLDASAIASESFFFSRHLFDYLFSLSSLSHSLSRSLSLPSQRLHSHNRPKRENKNTQPLMSFFGPRESFITKALRSLG